MKSFIRALAGRIGLYESIAFITGFVLMAFELIASRILAPTIGTSTYVWTSVIGVMIAALAAGYAAGGWIADRRAEKIDIAWLLLVAALSILVTGMFYEITLSAVSLLLHDPRAQGVVASVILFVPASFIMGMISPYLAKLRVHSMQTTGRSVAGLSALNSLGGITGTFCTGFIFFTIIGSRETLALLTGILIACSWLILPDIQRRGRLIVTIALTGALSLQFVTPVQAGIVADIDTPTSHYKIIDITLDNAPVRALIMGPGGLQSGSYRNGSKDLVFNYTRKIVDVVAAAPHKDRILILGGGAFSMPEYLGNRYPQATVDVVEIDTQLPEIAKKYFGYTPPPNVHAITSDARTYLEKTPNRYDVIIVDVYSDSSVPFALTTREYTTALKRTLQSDGLVVANIIASSNPSCMPLLASMHGSYQSSFAQALYYPLGDKNLTFKQNIIGVYANAPLSWASSITGRAVVRMQNGRSLTDNHAPTEYLTQNCKD